MASHRRRIVLAGATGLIGSELTEKLAEQGDEVIALVRDPDAGRRKAPGAARYLRWSSSTKEGEWRDAIDGADAVINLAGATVATRWTEQQKRRIVESRVQSTRYIVDAIGNAGIRPRVLINASAVGYYGTSDSATFTEDSLSGKDFLGETCRKWEEEAERAREFGLRVVLLRTGIVLDPAGGALGKLLPTFRLGLGGPLGSGGQWFPWIHMEDEIGIILMGLDDERIDGPLNAAAPGIVTNREFSIALGKTLHRPSFFAVPAFVLKLVFGGAATTLLEGQHVIPERTVKLGYRFRHPQLDEALRDLLGR